LDLYDSIDEERTSNLIATCLQIVLNDNLLVSNLILIATILTLTALIN